MSDADRGTPLPIDRGTRVALGPGQVVSSSFDPTRLDFGHHAGRRIEELAVEDPDYLRWLARHPSGARYRAEIARILGSLPQPDRY